MASNPGMNPERIYGYLATSRAIVLDQVGALEGDGYERVFDIGPGSLARTLSHVLGSEWYYVRRIAGDEVPLYETWPIREEQPAPFDELREAWTSQERDTRVVIEGVSDWTGPIVYDAEGDESDFIRVKTSTGDLFTQLVLHEVHHRAQALNMLRRLGADAVEIDYHWLLSERSPR